MMNSGFRIKIITKYIFKEFISTFIITFLFFLIVFMINNILLFITPLLQKNIPFNIVMGLMGTFLPLNIIFSLPFGMLLATLMVMGRFSSDNEIIAFRALGFNYMKIFSPIFIVAILVTLITFYVNDQLLPISYIKRTNIIKKISEIKPTIGFKSNNIKKHGDNKEQKTLYTNIVQDKNIKGLFIIDKDESGQKRIITAESAEILTPENRKGVIELKMNNTMIQFESADRPNEFNYGFSDQISYYFKLQDFTGDELKNTGSISKTTKEYFQDFKKYRKKFNDSKTKKIINLNEQIEDNRMTEKHYERYLKDNISYNQYLNRIIEVDTNSKKVLENSKNIDTMKSGNLNFSAIKFFEKFTFPLACIIFAIFAAPIGIYSRRAGYQIGFVIGLFLSSFYWFSFVGTILLGQRFILKPFLAMSLPNIVFLAIGSFFLFKRLRE